VQGVACSNPAAPTKTTATGFSRFLFFCGPNVISMLC